MRLNRFNPSATGGGIVCPAAGWQCRPIVCLDQRDSRPQVIRRKANAADRLVHGVVIRISPERFATSESHLKAVLTQGEPCELVVKHEFFGIQKCPADILVGSLGVLFKPIDVLQGDIHFLLVGITRKRDQIKLTDFFDMVDVLVGRQLRSASLASGQLALNLS